MDLHHINKIIQTEHTLLPHEWKGAVLFLCNEDYVFLIKRSEDMPTHSGQMAFIGGHKNQDEIHPWEVAQREFEEETSHSRNDIRLLGFLPAVMTARSRPIIPVMSELLISPEKFIDKAKSNGEWDSIVAYPWSELIKEYNWEFAWRHGTTKSPVMFHTIRAGTFISLETNKHPHLLWGATALMIWDFLRLYFKAEAGSY